MSVFSLAFFLGIYFCIDSSLSIISAGVPASSVSSGYHWKTNVQSNVFSPNSVNANRFCVRLPFDDLMHPELARKWVPPQWEKSKAKQKLISACQGRWIELRTAGGAHCFVQWREFDPSSTDNGSYVFGQNTPPAVVGLSISPEVAKCLKINNRYFSISWRFVDDSEVGPGDWLKYMERSVLFHRLYPPKLSTVPPANVQDAYLKAYEAFQNADEADMLDSDFKAARAYYEQTIIYLRFCLSMDAANAHTLNQAIRIVQERIDDLKEALINGHKGGTLLHIMKNGSFESP